MTAELSSPYLGRAGRSALLRALLRAYWSGVQRALGEPPPAPREAGRAPERVAA
jgi:hypothetical protein